MTTSPSKPRQWLARGLRALADVLVPPPAAAMPAKIAAVLVGGPRNGTMREIDPSDVTIRIPVRRTVNVPLPWPNEVVDILVYHREEVFYYDGDGEEDGLRASLETARQRLCSIAGRAEPVARLVLAATDVAAARAALRTYRAQRYPARAR